MGVEDWLVHLVGSAWVYVALYAFVMIDGFFPPIPSESAVIALAALWASGGEPNVYLMTTVAAVGAFTGDQIAYTLGSKLDVHRIRLFRAGRGKRSLDWAERALTRRGAAFILAARYIPVGRVAVNMTAGALGYPRRRFVGLTALAGVAWAVYATLIGIGAGRWLGDHPVVAVVVGVVTGLVLGLFLDWLLRRLMPASMETVRLDPPREDEPPREEPPQEDETPSADEGPGGR